MKEDSTVCISDFIEKASIEYGRELYFNRRIPNVYDGNTKIYQLLIQTANRLNNDDINSNTLIGECLKLTNSPPYTVITDCVNSGILFGSGWFGSRGLMGDPSNKVSIEGNHKSFIKQNKVVSLNHTKINLHPKIRECQDNYQDLIPKSYFNGELIQDYIPTPIPFCLVIDSIGSKGGNTASFPIFTAKSLVDSYLNNNPLLLRPKDGYKELEPNELLHVWGNSEGVLTYRLFVYEGIENNLKGYYLEGSSELFTPNISKLLLGKELGCVYIKKSINPKNNYDRIFFARIGGSAKYSDEYIHSLILEASIKKRNYKLRVVYKDQIRFITLKDWLEITVSNFSKLVLQYKKKLLEDISTKELVLVNYLKVIDLLINDQLSSEEISIKLSLDIAIVKDILNTSISTFRKGDIMELNNQKDIANRITPETEINNFLNGIDFKRKIR